MVPPIDLPGGRFSRGALPGIFAISHAAKADLIMGGGDAI
jgi:hypothetical protein